MKLKSIVTTALFVSGIFIFIACGGGENKDANSAEAQDLTNSQTETHGTEVKPSDVQLTSPLNQDWVATGKSIYDLKCQACHKLTDERLVGPGWKGVTLKREPHWIMNMITNVDMMLEKDPEAQKLLEQCLVRMPNQNISTDESRQILEFMRNNDGEK
ncbi:MAG TPA: c-type cytochrome [Chitinophagaceae bacterium]|nr:c-type cytochrome [Chitinophagaceae bacterium]